MKLKLLAMAVMAAALFSSCEKDQSEEYYLSPDGTTNTPTSALTNQTHCKDCNYYPTCSGSAYHYSDTSYGSATGTAANYTLQYVKDTVIASKTYQKITGAGQQNTYFNCTNGVSTSIVLNGTTAGGSTIGYAKITPIKAAEAVGATWADVITNGSGQPSTYTYTIISKSVSRTIAGNSYANVIQIHEQTTTEAPGFGTINSGHSEYYFAPGKGLIESISFDDFSGYQILHHVLLSASIP